jgi:tyrosyl-tRNA synthetase
MGGQDQWGNIVAGTDLIRRMSSQEAYGLTFPLLTDASGNKLGKTVAGAVWLSADKTSPFDFYQYWRNTEDRDVERFLKLFTFLPVDECARLGKLQPPLLNRAKEILGFEITAIVHGQAAAAKAYLSAVQHYPSADPGGTIQTTSAVRTLRPTEDAGLPEVAVPSDRATAGLRITDLLQLAGFCSSNSDARRLVQQGGVHLGDSCIVDFTVTVSAQTLASSPVLRAGKKRMARIVLK